MYKKSLERIFLSFRVERQKKSEREGREASGSREEFSSSEPHNKKHLFHFLEAFFPLYSPTPQWIFIYDFRV